YGALTVDAPEPYQFFVTLQGNTEEARLGVEAQMGNGALQFVPVDKNLPKADLDFNLMSVAWNSDGTFPRARLALSGGAIEHAPLNIHAENISGTLALDENGLRFEPLIAHMAGNTV